MKTICLILSFALMVIYTSAQNEVTLTVEISGLSSREGTLKIGLFNTEEGWLKTPYRGLDIQLSETDANTFTFEKIPPGSYAVSVRHDPNNNGKLDMGMMGPTEDYGFSNNASGMFGPADYEDAVIHVKENQTEKITLR